MPLHPLPCSTSSDCPPSFLKEIKGTMEYICLYLSVHLSSHWPVHSKLSLLDFFWPANVHCQCHLSIRPITLQWRHNECDGISNDRRIDCLLNRLFRCWSKKTSKLRLTGLCEGNSLVTSEFPEQGPVMRKMFLFDAVSMIFMKEAETVKDVANVHAPPNFSHYRKTCSVSRTKSQNLTVSRVVLQLSLPNPLKPGVESSMKM